MYVDSHCHLDLPELKENASKILHRMKLNSVTHALVVSLSKKYWQSTTNFVNSHENLWGSIGVHPCCSDVSELSVDELIQSSQHPKIVAIGETGLDYQSGKNSLEWQQSMFRKHIQASYNSKLPLVIHTRSSIEDSLKILNEENSRKITGVMHCFTENWNFAKKAIDLNFFISISGIVTFKKSYLVQELAQKIPLDYLLIETDSPFLSPEPYRGRINDPSNVPLIAQKIAQLREISVERVAQASSENFFRLFKKANRKKDFNGSKDSGVKNTET